MLQIYQGNSVLLYSITERTTWGSGVHLVGDTRELEYLCGAVIATSETDAFVTAYHDSPYFEESHSDDVPARYNNVEQLSLNGIVFPSNSSFAGNLVSEKYSTPVRSVPILRVPDGFTMRKHVQSGTFQHAYRNNKPVKEYYYCQVTTYHDLVAFSSFINPEGNRTNKWVEVRIWRIHYDRIWLTPTMYAEDVKWPGSTELLLQNWIAAVEFWTEYCLYKADSGGYDDRYFGKGFEPQSNLYYRTHPVIPDEMSFSQDYVNQLSRPDLSPNWREIIAKTYANCEFGFESNGIAYAKDMMALSESAKSTLASMKSVFGKTKKLKAISNLFLSFWYGWKLTVSDTKELLTFMDSMGFSHPNRRNSDVVTTFDKGFRRDIYAVYLYPFAKVQTGLDKLIRLFDLDIDLNNIWDLTPWSFVIDWFISIGDLADSLTGWMDLNYVHDVLCSSRTTMLQSSIDCSQLGFSGFGDVYYKYYNRHFRKYPEEPSFLVHVNGSEPMNHWVEGSALILSKY